MNQNSFDLQGRLFLHEQINKALRCQNVRQKEEDYNPDASFKSDCSHGFNVTQRHWKNFRIMLARTAPEHFYLEATLRFAESFFGRALGYKFERLTTRLAAGDRTFAVQALVNDLPLVVVSGKKDLDTPTDELAVEHVGGRNRKSAFQAAQEFLNASPGHTWGFAFNGNTVRLLRDSMSLSRPSYLEFRISDIMASESYSDFIGLFAVLHASRTSEADGVNVWESWIREGVDNGEPIRQNLARHVAEALKILGRGFIAEPSNEVLRRKLSTGEVKAENYFHELLRLLYRFLFVFCIEERNLIHPAGADEEAIRRYKEGYALHRFRDQSTKQRFFNTYTDAWESVKVVFKGLRTGEPRLALPALGGLFDKSGQAADLDLEELHLSNRAFFGAMKELRWSDFGGNTAPIDYRNLGTEELGSVYEGLLELIPSVNIPARTFDFGNYTNADNERKSSGSYYTPDSLVQSLIHTALDPVLEDALQKNPSNPEEALLSLRVIDPACGSGHFLLAAARRIAEALAHERSLESSLEGVVTTDCYQEALRDVIEHTIYGVDINPLAIELARISLWLEGFSRGKPLSFLDHHLKNGNSVIGIGSFDELSDGIPAGAFKPLEGDDKAVIKRLAAANRTGLSQLKKLDSRQLSLQLSDDPSSADELLQIEKMPSSTLKEVKEKAAAYKKHFHNAKESSSQELGDIVVSAFLMSKTQETEALVPTAANVCRIFLGEKTPIDDDLIEKAHELCRKHRVFHWPIEFDDVMRQGGFDCVLGNPPWDVAKIEDKKWFAARCPIIAKARTAAMRKKMIAALGRGRLHVEFEHYPFSEEAEKREKEIFRQYQADQQSSAAAGLFYHESRRYPLTGSGKTNLFALIAELMLKIRKPGGSAGMIVPPGLLTNDTYKDFAKIALSGKVASFHHFENTKKLFPSVASCFSFALVTFRESPVMDCVFYANEASQAEDPKRKIVFDSGDFLRLNPNTGTLFLPRTTEDLDLCRRIYNAAGGVLLESGKINGNPWHLETMKMFDMANDSRLFHFSCGPGRVPLYEGKMIHQFDNRFSTYSGKTNSNGDPITNCPSLEEKKDFNYLTTPRYWVDEREVKKAFERKKAAWDKPWMIAFRGIARATNQRTVIASVLPAKWAAGDQAPLLMPLVEEKLAACLLANLNSLVIDFVDRLKQPGANVSFFILNQLPVLSPQTYTEEDRDYIASRVARLTKNDEATAACWLSDFPAETYQDSKERLAIRAELDACFAHLYGLTRRDLEYILDPADVCGKDHPSVTFPGLRRDEESEYGEYLTRRLVLEAFDKLSRTKRFNRGWS